MARKYSEMPITSESKWRYYRSVIPALKYSIETTIPNVFSYIESSKFSQLESYVSVLGSDYEALELSLNLAVNVETKRLETLVLADSPFCAALKSATLRVELASFFPEGAPFPTPAANNQESPYWTRPSADFLCIADAVHIAPRCSAASLPSPSEQSWHGPAPIIVNLLGEGRIAVSPVTCMQATSSLRASLSDEIYSLADGVHFLTLVGKLASLEPVVSFAKSELRARLTASSRSSDLLRHSINTLQTEFFENVCAHPPRLTTPVGDSSAGGCRAN
jgi:hypothetical protein